MTFRLVVAPLRGPGRSPVLPFACCVGSLLSVGRCGALAGDVSAFAEPSSWCAGALLNVAWCAVCASAAPNSWRIGGCAGCCGGRLTVFAVHAPLSTGRPYRCVSVCVRPRCPVPPRAVPAVHHTRYPAPPPPRTTAFTSPVTALQPLWNCPDRPPPPIPFKQSPAPGGGRLEGTGGRVLTNVTDPTTTTTAIRPATQRFGRLSRSLCSAGWLLDGPDTPFGRRSRALDPEPPRLTDEPGRGPVVFGVNLGGHKTNKEMRVTTALKRRHGLCRCRATTMGPQKAILLPAVQGRLTADRRPLIAILPPEPQGCSS